MMSVLRAIHATCESALPNGGARAAVTAMMPETAISYQPPARSSPPTTYAHRKTTESRQRRFLHADCLTATSQIARSVATAAGNTGRILIKHSETARLTARTRARPAHRPLPADARGGRRGRPAAVGPGRTDSTISAHPNDTIAQFTRT